LWLAAALQEGGQGREPPATLVLEKGRLGYHPFPAKSLGLLLNELLGGGGSDGADLERERPVLFAIWAVPGAKKGRVVSLKGWKGQSLLTRASACLLRKVGKKSISGSGHLPNGEGGNNIVFCNSSNLGKKPDPPHQ